MSGSFKLLIILLLTLAAAMSAQGQPTAAASPAEMRLKELVKLVNSGNRAEARTYIAANFNDEMKKRPIERYLGFISTLYDQSRGLEGGHVPR